MTPRARALVSVLDVAGMTAFLLWFIWRGQFEYHYSWMVFVVWLAASFLVHRDTPRTLGWRADNLWPAARRAGIWFGAAALLLVGIGFGLGRTSELPEGFFAFDRLWRYFAFCLLQQVALCSYFTNRLAGAVERRWLAAVAAAVIFSAAHWPNPVLLPVTLAGGWGMAYLFARERNILPLAAAQALIGSLTWWAFPIEWHHKLRVGPGYFLPL
jgi:membrane protease YdiL (CAAX protease family)